MADPAKGASMANPDLAELADLAHTLCDICLLQRPSSAATLQLAARLLELESALTEEADPAAQQTLSRATKDLLWQIVSGLRRHRDIRLVVLSCRLTRWLV